MGPVEYDAIAAHGSADDFFNLSRMAGKSAFASESTVNRTRCTYPSWPVGVAFHLDKDELAYLEALLIFVVLSYHFCLKF